MDTSFGSQAERKLTQLVKVWENSVVTGASRGASLMIELLPKEMTQLGQFSLTSKDTMFSNAIHIKTRISNELPNAKEFLRLNRFFWM